MTRLLGILIILCFSQSIFAKNSPNCSSIFVWQFSLSTKERDYYDKFLKTVTLTREVAKLVQNKNPEILEMSIKDAFKTQPLMLSYERLVFLLRKIALSLEIDYPQIDVIELPYFEIKGILEANKDVIPDYVYIINTAGDMRAVYDKLSDNLFLTSRIVDGIHMMKLVSQDEYLQWANSLSEAQQNFFSEIPEEYTLN